MFTPFFLLLGVLAALLTNAFPMEKRASRTTAPAGAVVVKNPAASGQFSTIQAAVNSLPNDSSARTIFIFPGTRRNDGWKVFLT